MNQYNQSDKKSDSELTITCDRCGGTGYLPQYRHVQNGICFKCRGDGQITKRRIIYVPFTF